MKSWGRHIKRGNLVRAVRNIVIQKGLGCARIAVIRRICGQIVRICIILGLGGCAIRPLQKAERDREIVWRLALVMDEYMIRIVNFKLGVKEYKSKIMLCKYFSIIKVQTKVIASIFILKCFVYRSVF